MSSIHGAENSVWIGWNGIAVEELLPQEQEEVRRVLLSDHKSSPVSLSREELRDYYDGFCNDVIWPLFHYFPTYTRYEARFWEAYLRVNRKFQDAVSQIVAENDTVWVHDYQLMLLPQLIRERMPQVRIGFFLHIPFPSYEIFRLLPWRNEILEGLLGSDLIGFHTYDYGRHFISSVRRLLGLEHNLGFIRWNNRLIKADVFPMGINYAKYAAAGTLSGVKRELKKISAHVQGQRVILSVDRLDYSKGILHRLLAFQAFLEKHPDYRGRVKLILIVAPSRTKVNRYRELKRELDERVGIINGTLGTLGWLPVQYFFRSFSFTALSAFYCLSDILLVTPLRDGMNLIAKEFLAVKQDRRGVLILSETAGAARELGEAIIVNPNNIEEIAAAIWQALQMPQDEQVARNTVMLKRLSHYNVDYWAHDFLDKLEGVAAAQENYRMKKLSESVKDKLVKDYRAARRRLIILDYDGTLVPIVDKPEMAVPDEELNRLMKDLAVHPDNEVVLISGRDRVTLDRWFGSFPINLVAGHGVWFKGRGTEWYLREQLSNTWKDTIRPILELYADRTPGSMVEEKDYSLAWHYRRSEPELAAVRLGELKEALMELTSNLNLSVLEGKKVLEIKNSSISKGHAVSVWLARKEWDFLLVLGDDWTDEDMFALLPSTAYSIKVGMDISKANYVADSVEEVRGLLEVLAELGNSSG